MKMDDSIFCKELNTIWLEVPTDLKERSCRLLTRPERITGGNWMKDMYGDVPPDRCLCHHDMYEKDLLFIWN